MGSVAKPYDWIEKEIFDWFAQLWSLFVELFCVVFVIVYLHYFFQFEILTLLAENYLMFCKNLDDYPPNPWKYVLMGIFKNMSHCYIELTRVECTNGVCDIISRSVVILDLLDWKANPLKDHHTISWTYEKNVKYLYVSKSRLIYILLSIYSL